MALFTDPEGPIESLEWGIFRIDGTVHGESEAETLGAGKDIRIVGGTVTPWTERHGHRLAATMVTGIAPADAQVLVIGTGIYGRCKCPKKVLRELESRGLREIVVLPTIEACGAFNRLVREGRSVALLAHGTC
jgi:hypothetical protein